MTTIDVVDRSTSNGLEELREDILARLGRLICNAGHAPTEVAVTIERRGPDLRVELAGPALSRSTQAALAVRVLDAVHAADSTQGQVDVGYRVR